MESVVINTTQNVSINYEPAGVGNRILAVLLDGVFKIGIVFSFSLLISLIRESSNLNYNSTIYTVIGFMVFVPFLFYDVLFEIFMRGQTPGKKLIKIKVVKLDGTQPTVSAYLLRWLIGLFEFGMSSGLIAVICVAASKKSQRLGDMAAGTTVIHLRPKVTLQDTILQQEQKENYKITFQEVDLLSDADAQLIKDTLDFYKETYHKEALKKLSQKIKAKTNILTIIFLCGFSCSVEKKIKTSTLIIGAITPSPITPVKYSNRVF